MSPIIDYIKIISVIIDNTYHGSIIMLVEIDLVWFLLSFSWIYFILFLKLKIIFLLLSTEIENLNFYFW